MATTYPEAVRISDRPPAIRVSLPPTSPRAEMAGSMLAPFTSAPSLVDRIQTWFVAGSVVAVVAVGALAWPQLYTIGNAVLHLVQ